MPTKLYPKSRRGTAVYSQSATWPRQRCHNCHQFKIGVDYDPESKNQLCLDCRFPQSSFQFQSDGKVTDPAGGIRLLLPETTQLEA